MFVCVNVACGVFSIICALSSLAIISLRNERVVSLFKLYSFLNIGVFVCHTVLSVPCSLVVTCWERADLLALVYDVFLCFCHVQIWCSRSGVVFNCIDS